MTSPLILFSKIIEELEGAELSQMFGKPCGKFQSTSFVCFFQEEMAFKIGREAIEKILPKYKDSKLFDPSGKKRPFKDWIQLSYDYKEEWKDFAHQALKFISSDT